MRKPYLAALFMLLAVGCAPWSQIGGPYSSGSNGFTVDLPQGWMKYNMVDFLFITRDGGALQNIIVERFTMDKELPFTKKKFAKAMLPQELAEVVVDNVSSNPANLNLVVIENVPEKVCGSPGFKVILSYKTKDGLRMKSISYGVLVGDYVYNIRYNAAERYYFDKDLPVFQEVFASFRLTKS
jgi:hypothetical protein